VCLISCPIYECHHDDLLCLLLRPYDQGEHDVNCSSTSHDDVRYSTGACYHVGPCSKLVCVCKKKERYCGRYCGCSSTCGFHRRSHALCVHSIAISGTSRWPGCSCKRSSQPCKKDSCACRKAKRECEPYLCSCCPQYVFCLIGRTNQAQFFQWYAMSHNILNCW
jgi:hypothetical protein